MGQAVQPTPAGNPVHYERRRPEETTLYRLVQEHLETFLDQLEAKTGASLPDFVKDEFDAFLACGILAHGFLRLRCGDCAHEKLVAFSCKRRGYAECGNMLSGEASEGATTSGFKRFAAAGSQRAPHIVQPWSEAISLSGGRNLPGRSWGGVTDPRTSILCDTSTRR